MDIAELLEAEKRRQQAAEEDRQKGILDYQIRGMDKEKVKWQRRVYYKIKKDDMCLDFLRREKDREIDNYIAVKSDTMEQRYHVEEGLVRNLLQSIDTAKAVLKQQKQDRAKLAQEILDLENAAQDVKKETGARNAADSLFRLPCERKMDNRVEWASMQFHKQMEKNRELETKIDELLFCRARQEEVAHKLQKELDDLNRHITLHMEETAVYNEERERVEATRLKVKDHLHKVTVRYERDLLNLTVVLTDDKETDTFMRTKHKEIAQKLIKQRQEDLEKAQAMLAQKDEWQKQLEHIRIATGEPDIDALVQRFLEHEDDNFATFLSIGELLRDNEELRAKIREIQIKNVDMEERNIKFDEHIVKTIAELEANTESYKKKSESCIESLADSSGRLEEYLKNVKQLVHLLQIPASVYKAAAGPDGVISDTNVLGCMRVIENAVSDLLKDYYILELTVRVKAHKLSDDEEIPVEDLKMMTRVPSLKIEQNSSKYRETNTQRESHKEKHETRKVRKQSLQPFDALRDLVVKEMLEEHSVTHGSSSTSV